MASLGEDELNLALDILSKIGGAVAIISGLSAFLGKIWAERIIRDRIAGHERTLESLKAEYQKDIEGHKIKLKKSELFFERQLEAANALSEFKESLLGRHDFPDETIDDALERMGSRFNHHADWIQVFMARYAVVLPEKIKKKLREAFYIADTIKFDTQNDPEHLPVDFGTKAQEFWDLINEANNCYLEYIRTQAGAEESSLHAD